MTGTHAAHEAVPRADRADPNSLDALIAAGERRTDSTSVPHATEIVHEIPVYDGAEVERLARDAERAETLLDEWRETLARGAGVLAIRRAIADTVMLDEVTALFERIMVEEAGAGSDHFAPAGANTRIWNAHEKLAVRAPALFLRYNASVSIALASRAWLGPDYQVTAQVNVVKPGGAAQTPHRDYHLGFMEPDRLARYPAQVHALSPYLTLQGAIAHSDMPLESGPTQLLPFSQSWPPGYAASVRDDVRAHFAARHVQLALGKGDMLFFSPALLHAAGDNRTADLRRVANLLQVSSAFGRAMEIVDRARLCRAIYPELLRATRDGELDGMPFDEIARDAVVAASAEGYPFPANLEIAWPEGGLRPPAQRDLLVTALDGRHPPERFAETLDAHVARQRSH